ncbi:Ubiquitin-associated/translation elongation factor EF1B protein [Perilla frutescens var. hirtella]|uniref:Ubiquitin-associated/translation elongation factor EF1B protein n=1 Tax=Perilla frutescens var. hirtella TaxID=608512 RepID=A0AAD4IVT9_PERFH|nr:Ubiquitin-associated/translation elongation factor EF1B protein [Perilla frutescens var. frutescens]KAH6784027.1 Ubiquitin-associated/translation elongation factor EF1B protein [Perilla frutescens var. hirtella]KAH6822214.1 Ubiquitin-associated/translation elongation factor EF1B protein [Perilla frutescens var. hirtella]
MEYDFRKRAGPPYDSNAQSYGRPPSAAASSAAASHPVYGQQSSFYPKIGTAGPQSAAAHVRNPPFHQAPPPPSNSGIGIRVAIKPEYRITPPPPLLPHLGEIARSNFHFDFEFERNVLTEAVKENPNWGRLGIEHGPPKATEPTPSYGHTTDPVVRKYIAAGLSREAVPLAVANYGDNPSKVKEFATGFTLLREMGFSSNNVADALIMYDNDTDKALAQLINTPQ